MLSIGLKKGDIILMPSVNFISSFNMAKVLGLKVFLIDVDEYTGQITPMKIKECIKKNKLKKISALIVMFHGGYPENVKKFYELKKKYNFRIIEDACHALGAEYKINNTFFKVGSCKHSDISTFSLHPLKTITSGEGGVITTNDPNIAKKIELFRSHGILRSKEHWKYDVIEHGYNYRMSDINSALGLSQLKKINYFIKKRKKIYENYLKAFKNLSSNLVISEYTKEIKPSYHLCVINIIFDNLQKKKDHFIKYLMNYNILTQQHYIPIYKFKIYKKTNNQFSGSEKYFKNSISIPIYVNLTDKEQRKIIKIIKKYFNK